MAENQTSKIKCEICPRYCNLAENQSGFCSVRQNINGKIELTTYGYNTGLAIDPIEKKPLYHFYPNSAILSFGTMGCNMGCKFCQNWQTTKQRADVSRLNPTSPKNIVKIAKQYNCKSVAFTYNDPIIFYEYVIDTAKLCHENDIKTVVVTSGYINPEPRKEFFKYIDAANIDLKGFSEEFYQKHCMAHLEPVLDTIKYVKQETDCHLELTTLLIEKENNSASMIKDECEWILENLGDNIPLHFSAFHPDYKYMNYPKTSLTTLLNAYNMATLLGLKYVYTGNVLHNETSTTFCPNCHKPLIVRNGFKVLENHIQEGKCSHCNTPCEDIII